MLMAVPSLPFLYNGSYLLKCDVELQLGSEFAMMWLSLVKNENISFMLLLLSMSLFVCFVLSF